MSHFFDSHYKKLKSKCENYSSLMLTKTCGCAVPSSGRWWVLQTGNSLLLLLVDVALKIEVTEEDDEGDAVTKHHRVHGVGEVALCEQVVARVKEEQHKLHQLQRCQVFLPPQVLLHVRADGRQPVVRVHHNVDEGVDQADEE